MNAWQTDPYRLPGLRGLPHEEEADARLPPTPLSAPLPDPALRPAVPESADRRRLDLHACLTAAGIPPRAGDLHAIEVLTLVDDTTYAALRRWITGTS
ncbi:hypothetical protein BX286_4029 [Streptomyces sp. 3211.6]|uniref:hypothetical protein n=1 Tax=Streptomyces sp. 3211.6 TaxID=1938845 RepID=UPI000F20FBD1|nr:hypothetical protein [Streptomyces sp. 3211.6]RKT05996.1 hypothetical protein BX286_4029 [Streptomyces sp. 3211.6]